MLLVLLVFTMGRRAASMWVQLHRTVTKKKCDSLCSLRHTGSTRQRGCGVGCSFVMCWQHLRTPLVMAATAGHVGTVQLLIDAGAQLEFVDNVVASNAFNSKRTALMAAAKMGHYRVVAQLIKANACLAMEDTVDSLVTVLPRCRMETTRFCWRHKPNTTR